MGANPVDRGKPGSKLQLVGDGGGLPLTAVVTAANVNDTIVFQAVMDDVPPIRLHAFIVVAGGREARRLRPIANQVDDLVAETQLAGVCSC